MNELLKRSMKQAAAIAAGAAPLLYAAAAHAQIATLTDVSDEYAAQASSIVLFAGVLILGFLGAVVVIMGLKTLVGYVMKLFRRAR